jgi:rod shape-determining protein MreC
LGSLLRRYGAVLFVLGCLALPILVFLANGRRPRTPNWLDRVVITLTAPVEHALVVVAFGVTDAFGNYIWLRHVREESLTLRREMLRQRGELQLFAEAQAENTRLRALLDYADKTPGLKLLAAPVIAVGPSQHSHTLRIARGTNDGVRRGMPVIAPEGIVGTVAQATGSYADVALIVGPQSAVPALSARTRGRSTVRGTGDINRCRLDYALRTDELQEGDWVLTAGGEGFFPKGLRIGRVGAVQRKATGMFIGAEVLPAVQFNDLDEVLVVLEQPVEPPSSPSPGPATTVTTSPGVNPDSLLVKEPPPPPRPIPGSADTEVRQ